MRSLLLSLTVMCAWSSPVAAQSGTPVDKPVVTADGITPCRTSLRCIAPSLTPATLVTRPAHLAVRISRDHPSEAPLQGLSCDKDAIGLPWALCRAEVLRYLAVRIEARQRTIRQNLDAATGDALFADWRLLLDALSREVGARWLDSLAEDIAVDLERYMTFLVLIQRRDEIEGYWGNHQASLRISTEGGRQMAEVRSLSCEFTLPLSTPGLIERVGDGLRLTVPLADFEREYPGLGGCFRRNEDSSVVNGVYFPLMGRPD